MAFNRSASPQPWVVTSRSARSLATWVLSLALSRSTGSASGRPLPAHQRAPPIAVQAVVLGQDLGPVLRGVGPTLGPSGTCGSGTSSNRTALLTGHPTS